MVELDGKNSAAPPRAGNRDSNDAHGNTSLACVCLRHITSIQIRNFTPSPVQDAVASVLAQPSLRPNAGAERSFIDDTDVNRTRRRSRRVSEASVVTLRNAVAEDTPTDRQDEFPTLRERKNSSASASSHVRPSILARRGTFSTKLQRLDSLVSTAEEIAASGPPSVLSMYGINSNHSQKNLEKLFRSRLVETFVTVHAVSPSGATLHSQGDVTSIPDYLSSVHPPSTNPCFNLGPDDFSSCSDVGALRTKVAIYGKLLLPRGSSSNGKGKDMSYDGLAVEGNDVTSWTLLQSWAVDLNELVPLTEEELRYPSRLPFNSLVLTLAPLGVKFRLPHVATRNSLSATTGHSSDTEVDPRTAIHSDTQSGSRDLPQLASRNSTSRAAADTTAGNARRRHTLTQTASWQDLLKLGTLKTSIADTEQSLVEIISTINELVLADGLVELRRRQSEQEQILQTRRADEAAISHNSNELRQRLQMRRKEFENRQSILAAAKLINEGDVQACTEEHHRLLNERHELDILRSKLLPRRRALVTRLSDIFPIELASPEDLLFTIISAPLPIPLSVADPAPPLSLPKHREVTEDAVATALGYAALVVQLLAAYLGQLLVYPVTFVGSRSLIRDDISAMVGPRMFPLYSKGVDTYRFEYGVFLLNKNIELLMADRNLRALDIRHTLPNLKNLLLTLTDAEAIPFSDRPHNHSTSSLLSLCTVSPTRDSSISSAVPSDLITDETDTSEELASTPSTPKADSSSSRKSKGYFGLSPLTGFLRGRYPSSASMAPPVKVVAEASEEERAGLVPQPPPTDNDDQADRLTLRGGVVLDDRGSAKNPAANGHASLPQAGDGLKEQKPSIITTPASPASPVVS